MQWTADNSTGYANLFKVYVTFENTIYENLPGCDFPTKKTATYERYETYIELTYLAPFSRYSVRVIAANNYGVSSHSKKQFFNTQPSTSSSPRFISIEFIDDNNEALSLSGVLRWAPPCKLNGLFSLYTVSLKGSRLGYDDHSITQASSYQSLTVNELKRGYKYDVKVQAISSGFTGQSEKFHFTAPSGSKFKALMVDKVIYSTSLKYRLKRTSIVGQLLSNKVSSMDLPKSLSSVEFSLQKLAM